MMFSTATFSKLVALVVVAVAINQSTARPLGEHDLAARGYSDEAALYERGYEGGVSELSLRDLEERAGEKKKSKKYVCSKCDATFDDATKLETHKFNKHPNDEYKPIPKSKKKRSYGDVEAVYERDLGELLNELEVRAGDKKKSKKYVCSKCDATFDDATKLETHKNNKHPNDEYKPIPKSKKKRSYGDDAAVYERGYDDVSVLSLRDLGDLLNELEVRAGDKKKSKKYVCSKCDATFDDATKLETHKFNKHPDDEYKPIPKSKKKRSYGDDAAVYERGYDDVSVLSLRDLGDLLNELEVRAGDKKKSKKYVCSKCDATFDDATKLETHKNNKHPNDEYKPIPKSKKK